MRWFPLLALMLGAGCDRDELDELRSGPQEELEDLPSSDHGSVVQEMGLHEAKEALDRGDMDAFVRQIERHLDSFEQWATTFEADISTGELRASPEVREAFEAWKVEYAQARQQFEALRRQRSFPQSEAEDFYERVEKLAVDVREISTLRRAQLEG